MQVPVLVFTIWENLDKSLNLSKLQLPYALNGENKDRCVTGYL